jgi:phosphopantothenoylcysteine decarboxylase/phosphopantothenate--cysteine ligase
MYTNHITLVITGSIAAVKSFDLIQQLQAKHVGVSVILTEAAQQWVTPEAATLVTGTETLTTKTASSSWIRHSHKAAPC